MPTKQLVKYKPDQSTDNRSVDLAKAHKYERGNYGYTGKKSRLEPLERLGQILNAAIDLSIGIATASDHMPTIFDTRATEIKTLCGVSTGSVFVYFPAQHLLLSAMVEWAKVNSDSDQKETKEAARIILVQWASVFKEYAESQGYKVSLRIKKE
jgi:hypothetical protein